MELISNSGTDRVLDLIQPPLVAGASLDVPTPAASMGRS